MSIEPIKHLIPCAGVCEGGLREFSQSERLILETIFYGNRSADQPSEDAEVIDLSSFEGNIDQVRQSVAAC
ncbi:hypothetical protein KKA33_03120 [Patescibacteria group bacterium]|nr:hypothetical protein [Patescibacteria group bacterium]